MGARCLNDLSDASAGYIAGIIDGEGTVTLSRKSRSQNRQLCISISSTEREILDVILRQTGVGKITCKRKYSDHHRASFTYSVYNRHALALLERIRPLLNSYKATRADLILDHYLELTPRNGKYSEELKQRRQEFEDRVLSTLPKNS